MPSWSKVRRTGNDDCSTSRMISSFSAAAYLMYRTPHPPARFFEQAVLQHQLGQQLLELVSLHPQPLNFIAGRFTRGIAGQPLLARLQEVLGPAIVEVLIDPFLAAQLGRAVLAAQAGDHDPDLVLSREVPAGRPPYVAYRLFHLIRLRIDFRSHLSAPSAVKDEPKVLSFSIASNCPTCADGEQYAIFSISPQRTRKSWTAWRMMQSDAYCSPCQPVNRLTPIRRLTSGG